MSTATTFEYKGVTVLVDAGNRKISYTSPEDPNEHIIREAQAIAIGYGLIYKERGEFPSLEEGRRCAAYLLMPPEACGDVKRRSPRDLAASANVTEEFAQYRIELDIQNQ